MDDIDFSSLSSEHFDCVEWLNKIFMNNDNKIEIDKKSMANNLIFKLQLMIEETNNSLQSISKQMSLSMPSVINDTNYLQNQIKHLNNQMTDVHLKLINSDAKHSSLINSLAKLDSDKQQLQQLYQALQETNNWSKLSMDIEDVFDSGDVEQISIKILNMQKSLKLLSDSNANTNLDDKFETLENLKDKFAKLIEPMLIDSILKSDESMILYYSNFFHQFQRTNHLIKLYNKCFKEELLKEWTIQLKLDNGANTLNQLNFLFDRMNSLWKNQSKLLMIIFETVRNDQKSFIDILCDISTDILDSLEPSVDKLIEDYVQNQIPNNVTHSKQNELIKLKQLTNNFIRNLAQSVDLNSKFSSKSMEIFLKTTYRPLAKMNMKFISFEKESLDNQLEDILQSELEHPNILKLFAIIRDSYKKYEKFIETYPLLLIENVIEDLLWKYVGIGDSDSKNLKNIDQSKNYNNQMPNWQYIQKLLFKFESFGNFMQQLQSFSKQIHANFIDYKSINNIFQRFDLYMLNIDENQELINRVESYIEQPSTLLSRVSNECINAIKTNAFHIESAMFDYVETQLNMFDKCMAKLMVNKSLIEDHVNSPSMAPNEYVTQIGQYLLLLPQHLEPFNMNDNSSFKLAFSYCADIMALDTINMAPNESLLELIQRKTIKLFIEHVTNIDPNIRFLHDHHKDLIRKQISIDLSYLLAVCEDLGFINPPNEALLSQQLFQSELSKWSEIEQSNSEHEKFIDKLENLFS